MQDLAIPERHILAHLNLYTFADSTIFSLARACNPTSPMLSSIAELVTSVDSESTSANPRCKFIQFWQVSLKSVRTAATWIGFSSRVIHRTLGMPHIRLLDEYIFYSDFSHSTLIALILNIYRITDTFFRTSMYQAVSAGS